MKTLDEKFILKLIKEEWDNKLNKLQLEIDTYYKPPQGQDNIKVIGVGLKVRDKDGNAFTVRAVHPHKYILKSDADGAEHEITDKQFEDSFERV